MGVKVQDIELAQAIVEHVDTHLHERMTLDDLVAATHYSKFHLHRAFTTVLGLPVHTYVQRRRLSEAASLLVHSRRSILDIALLSGYQSQRPSASPLKACISRRQGRFVGERTPIPCNAACRCTRTLPRPSSPDSKSVWRTMPMFRRSWHS